MNTFLKAVTKFQLTAARRRLRIVRGWAVANSRVSTHSRSKAAARNGNNTTNKRHRFNSQPLEGGCVAGQLRVELTLSFNSQPLEGGCKSLRTTAEVKSAFQLTAARRRLQDYDLVGPDGYGFQLTAARRRLRPHGDVLAGA